MYMSFKTRKNEIVDVKQAAGDNKTLLSIRDNQRKMMVLSKMNGFYGDGTQKFPRKYHQLAVQPFRDPIFSVDKFSHDKY